MKFWANYFETCGSKTNLISLKMNCSKIFGQEILETVRFLPVKVHVGGERFGTVVKDESVEWSKCTMEPHFKELLALDLNMTSLLRHHDIIRRP